MHDAHGAHGGGHGAHDHRPLLPATSDIGKGGFAIVVLAILTSIMQGSFVVASSHEMHIWGNPVSDTVKAATQVDLPPYGAQAK